jgi:hypothetical protein
MLKIRIPYSGILALVAYVIRLDLLTACITGIVTELVIAIVLFKKLIGEKEFEYDSFVGQLLLQYTMLPEVGLTSLLHLISARIASYALLFIIYTSSLMWFWYVIPIVLYLSTVIHYLPNNKKPIS